MLTRLNRALAWQPGRPVELASLTAGQLEIVRVFRRGGPTSLSDIAVELGVSAAFVSSAVDELRHQGIVEESGDRVELVPAVRMRLEKWHEHGAAVLSDAIGRLSDTERSHLDDAVPVLVSLASSLQIDGR